jgi:bromodomain-containing protein 7/9
MLDLTFIQFAIMILQNDFKLVTSNARTFNPPSTLYHIEALRIEAWGLDQITKASGQVIQYETDWTVDVVADVEPTMTENTPLSTGAGAEVPSDEATPGQRRSPSVLSSAPGAGAVIDKIEKKRASRAQKKNGPVVSASFESNGRLPGSLDGLGSFPAGSELAGVMLWLKLKGKLF